MSSTVFYAGASQLAVLANTFLSDGSPGDPATITVIVTDPTGTQVTYTYAGEQITRNSPGSYEISVSCTLDGLWSYVWVGTGAVSDVQAGTWTVMPETPRNFYTSVEQLKSRLGITDDDDDLELQLAVQSAAAEIQRRTGRFFWNETGVRTYRPQWIYAIEIDDLVTITEFATDIDGDGVYETVWTPNQYQLEVTEHQYNPYSKGEWWPYTKIQALGVPGGNYLPYVWAWSHQDRIQVTGTFGWLNVPVLVRQASLVIATEFFKQKDAPVGMMSGLSDYDAQISAMLSRYVKSQVKVGM